MLPSNEQKSILIFPRSLRLPASQELQGQEQAERLLSLWPGHPTLPIPGVLRATGAPSVSPRQTPLLHGDRRHDSSQGSCKWPSSNLKSNEVQLQAKAGLPEQSGDAVGTRINLRRM